MSVSVVLVGKNLFSNSYSYLNDDRNYNLVLVIVCSQFLDFSYSYSFCLKVQLI